MNTQAWRPGWADRRRVIHEQRIQPRHQLVDGRGGDASARASVLAYRAEQQLLDPVRDGVTWKIEEAEELAEDGLVRH